MVPGPNAYWDQIRNLIIRYPKGKVGMRGIWILFVVLLVFPSTLYALPPKVDPETGRIRVLFIGDPFLAPGYPTAAMVEDPKIQLTRIEAEIGYKNPSLGYERMQRFLRLYLPRSEKDLLEHYDEVIVTAIRSCDLKTEFQDWVKRAVQEHGFGFLMSDDPTSFGGAVTVWTTGPPWDDTPIGSILPVYQTDHSEWRDHNFRIKPKIPNPITNGIPWKKMPRIWSHNRPSPKPGATVLAVTTDETVATDPKNMPVLIYWDTGKGRSLAFVWDWGGNGVVPFYRWEYWKDVIARIVYFPVRAKIPEDLSVTHTLRMKIGEYASEKGLVLSMIDFADKFGANTNPLDQHLAQAEAQREKVDELWIKEQYEKCLPAMDDAMKTLSQVMDEAVRAKDRALLWVYIVEWLTVSGTAILTGVVIWSLMVRRRLYREVETTRFAGSH